MAVRNQTVGALGGTEPNSNILKVLFVILCAVVLCFYILHNWFGFFGGKSAPAILPSSAPTVPQSSTPGVYVAGSKITIHQDGNEAVVTVKQISGSKATVTSANGDTFECSVASLGNPVAMRDSCKITAAAPYVASNEKFSQDYIDYASSEAVVCPIVKQRQGENILDKSVTCAEVQSAARQMMQRHNEGN